MLTPRARVIVSAAASTPALAALLGRVDMAVPAVVVLLLVAQAAALTATSSAAGYRLASAAMRVAPVWVLIVFIAALRANSLALAEVRGANAVAGPALTHGDPILVAACWVGLLAGIIALAGAMPPRGLSSGPAPVFQAELLAAVGLILVLVTLFIGPQVDGAADLLPWIVATAVLGGVVFIVKARIGPWATRLATALAMMAAVAAALVI